MNYKEFLFYPLLVFFLGIMGYVSLNLMGYTVSLTKGISMLPTIKDGCLIIEKELKNPTKEVRINDIVSICAGCKYYVHRVIGYCDFNGIPGFITKGDNLNHTDGCWPFDLITHKLVLKFC
jgi:signal peptidase I